MMVMLVFGLPSRRFRPLRFRLQIPSAARDVHSWKSAPSGGVGETVDLNIYNNLA